MKDWLLFKELLFFTCHLWVVHSANGEYWTAADFPDPQTQHTECGQDKPSWICDPNKLIADPATTASLEASLEEFQHINPCKCNCDAGSRPTYVKVAIGIVSGIEGNFADEAARKSAVQEFASELAVRRWGSVDGSCGDHVVMVYSVREGAVGAAVGSVSAADGLTEDCVHARWSDNSDYFAKGDYGAGFMRMLDELKEVAQGKRGCNGGSYPVWLIGPLVVVIVVAGGSGGYAKKRGCRCCRRSGGCHSVEGGSGAGGKEGGEDGGVDKDAQQVY